MRLSSVARSSVIIGLCGFLSARASAQQLKLGDNPSVLRQDAVLELNSPNQGLLLPRVLKAEITSGGKLFNAPNGMLVYVTDAAENAMYVKRFGIWQKVGDFSATSISGDVSATGTGAITTTIANQAVTFAKMQNINTQRLLGRYSPATGSTQEIQLGSNLTLNTSGVLSANNMSALWNANKLQGADVATTAPADGDVLKYNSTTSSWTPAQASGITSLTGSIIATGNGEVTAYIQDGAVQYVKIQQMPGQTLMGNSQTGNAVVAPISIGAGLTLNAGTSVLSAANTSALWNANQLQGRDVNNTAPTNGQVLKWNGSAWAPGADAGGSITLQDDITGTGTGTISTTISNKAVTYAKMQDVTGSRLLGRYATTAGTAQEISLGTTMSLSTGGVLSAANTTALWNANELQGRDIATTAPTNGQVLKWNGTLWAPAADASGSISLTGPITGTSSTGTIATTITDDAVTFAKMQDVSTQRLLGRYSTGTGDVQEVSLGANMLLNTSGQLSADANNALWNANKFQGRSIVSATPTNGQVYKYNTSTSTWELGDDLSGGATYGTLANNDISQADAPDAFSRMKIWASPVTGTVTNGPAGTGAYSWNVLSFRGGGYTTQLYFDKSTLAVKEWGGNTATLTSNADNPWYKVVLVHGNTNIDVGAIPFGGKTTDASSEVMQDASRLFWNNTNKRLGVGTNAPNSTMQVNGSIAETLTIVNSNTTLTESINTLVVRRTGSGTANITVTVPSASTCPGRIYTIIKDYTGGVSGNLILSFASGETPGFQTSYGNSAVIIKLMSVGTKWARVSYVDNGVF